MKRGPCKVCYQYHESNNSGICSKECAEKLKKSTQAQLDWNEKLKQAKAHSDKIRAHLFKASPRKKLKKHETPKNLEKLIAKNEKEYVHNRWLQIQRLGIALGLPYPLPQYKRLATQKPQPRKVRPPHPFYDSEAWQKLRYQAYRAYPRVCMCCGAKDCELHVDHIKPRSKYPELELEFNNLQVLCRSCNMGKSDTDETDFRSLNINT